MVGSDVWGEYFFSQRCWRETSEKGGCGNVVSSVDCGGGWLATMGEIESRIVDPCRCQDSGSQNKGAQRLRLCTSTRAPAQDGLLAGSGIESAVINDN